MSGAPRAAAPEIEFDAPGQTATGWIAPRRAPAREFSSVLRGLPWTLLFVAWDVLVAGATILLTARLAGDDFLAGGSSQSTTVAVLAITTAAVAPLANAIVGAYAVDVKTETGPVRWAGKLVMSAIMVTWVAAVAASIGGGQPHMAHLAAASLALPAGWLFGRVGAEVVRSRGPQRVIVVGSGRIAVRISALTQRHGRGSFSVVGFVDDDPHFHPEPTHKGNGSAPEAGVRCLGGIDTLPGLIDRDEVDRVLVAFSASSDEEVLRVLRDCDAHGVDVDIVPRLFDLIGPDLRGYSLGGLPVLTVRGNRSGAFAAAAKRTLDIIGASLLLLLAAPIMAVVALAILFDSGRPIFYLQERVGRDGRLFKILKFRTMHHDSDPGAAPIAAVGAGRLTIDEAVEALKREALAPTRTGRFLRRTSLDELPQLLNVLFGDMSLVGPRPLRPFEVATLDGWRRRRQSVRPGMTGLWQVLGRSEVPWDERMELDYSYVRHWSLAHDVKILLRTLGAVISRRGAY